MAGLLLFPCAFQRAAVMNFECQHFGFFCSFSPITAYSYKKPDFFFIQDISDWEVRPPIIVPVFKKGSQKEKKKIERVRAVEEG